MNNIAIGYKAICERLALEIIPHYRESYIAKHGRGKTIIANHQEIHIYPKSYALKNPDDLLANLEFALKYDGVNLVIIKALFEKIGSAKIVAHIQKQPTGIYSRKIWYLYEFLMNEKLDLPDCQQIKYVNLLDSKKYFTSQAIKSQRHAINDNLLGNNKFCPFVRRTELLEKYLKLHLDEKAEALLAKYDPHLIARACQYLYTKETMSSYLIEKEQPDMSRVARFILALREAPSIESLSKTKLIELQNIIVDPRFKDSDYRTSQNYVGENINPYFQKIHYISPKPSDVGELMIGLLNSLDRMLMTNTHAVIVAAAIAFGFVFIHPFEDGNGRIHRFLIHYILSKKNFTPKNIIFPVSSIMLKNIGKYDATLESFSSLLLSIVNYNLSDDGVLQVNGESKILYQYIDFTVMTEYLFSCIEEALNEHLEQEILFLINYDKTKIAMQNIIDMPDNKIDLFIRCVIQNNGALSIKKRESFFSLLTNEEIDQLSRVIRDNMIHKPKSN